MSSSIHREGKHFVVELMDVRWSFWSRNKTKRISNLHKFIIFRALKKVCKGGVNVTLENHFTVKSF